MYELNTIGAIVLFNGTTPPEGWVFCEGQQLSEKDNQALFSVIGDTYHQAQLNQFGVYERGNFSLPKLSNVGSSRYIICTSGNYPYHD